MIKDQVTRLQEYDVNLWNQVGYEKHYSQVKEPTASRLKKWVLTFLLSRDTGYDQN